MGHAAISSPKQLSPAVATLLIALATIGYALQPLFAKALSSAGLVSPAIAFHRFLLTALLLLPALTFAGKKRGATFWAIGSSFWE